MCRVSPTLKQIARETGVAISTVSRALNGHPHVDEQTRRRVQEAADRLGYRPSVAARALRGSGTRTVGVVLPDMMNHFYARTVSVLQDQLEERGFGVVLTVTANDGRREREALDRLGSRQVDGIIIVPTIMRLPPSPDGVPIIELNRQTSRAVDKVGYDEAAGSQALVDHLVAQGHTQIAYIGGEGGFTTTRNRIAGFRTALEAANIDAQQDWFLLASHTRAWGAEATRRILDAPAPDRPTAVFAASSEIALGFLTAARHRGLRLPDDLSLVAFGDPDWYEVVTPSITCYDQPIAQCASIAVQLLANRMAGTVSDQLAKVIVEGRVVLRESVAAPTP